MGAGMFNWRTRMWMETAHWSFKQLVGLFVLNLFILLFTFPFGISICIFLFARELIKGVPSPVHEGHGKKKKVAIIGGGVSGITSAVCMVEEGHEVEIFERDHTWGGVWQFSSSKRTEEDEFSGQVWQDLITTSSAYITSFSAFPPPSEKVEGKEFPYHMTAAQYYNYLTAYMKDGGVEEKVFNFNTQVKKMSKKTVEGETKWDLIVESKEGKQRTVEADWVIVSTGQHQVTKDQTFEGLNDVFQGDIVHSSDYINPKPFVNKSVLVIGGGDSGADIVKHIGDICKKGHCYMSLRRGAHVAPRYFHKDELPIDYAMFRYAYYLPHLLRTNVLRRSFFKVMNEVAKNCETSSQMLRLHHLNGMSASTYFTTKSEEMCKAFASGTAQLKPGVKRFTKTGVEFLIPEPNVAGVDTSPVEIDAVVLCTGFTTVFPMLPDEFQDHSHLDRYRLVFHPDMDNVAFVGFVRPTGFGAIPPCSEMQARWVAQVVSGKVDLPPKKTMVETAQAIKKVYLATRLTPNQMLVFFPYYLAEVAYEFGVNPSGFKLFMESPKLWYNVMFGPYTSHQYRLFGPHAKPEIAKDMILNRITQTSSVKAGPLNRPPKPALIIASLVFGIISKIPITGKPFAPCV